jgi:Adaptor complexes medium subunit family
MRIATSRGTSDTVDGLCCKMLSLLLLCDADGRPLIGRDYRGDVGSVLVKAFCVQVLRYLTSDAPPVILFEGSTFFVRRLARGGGTLVGATSSNINAALALTTLVAVERLLEAFGVLNTADGAMRQSDILSHASVVYALLDEALDQGWPQMLDAAVLSQTMLLSDARMSMVSAGQAVAEGAASPYLISSHASSLTPWRPSGVVTGKPNKLKIDLVERVSAQLNSAGAAVNCEVHGQARLTCRLSGMPSCMMVLNSAVRPGQGDNARSFHPCVQLDRLEATGELVFVPPHGEFELMSWHTRVHVTPPLKVSCSRIMHGRTRQELLILLRAQLPSAQLSVFDIRVAVPLPGLTSGTRTRLGGAAGTAKWVRGENIIKWKVHQLTANGEASLAVDVTTAPSTHGDAHTHLAPLVVRTFNVPGHSATGLRVRALQVANAGEGPTTKLVRYSVCAGTYEVRMP